MRWWWTRARRGWAGRGRGAEKKKSSYIFICTVEVREYGFYRYDLTCLLIKMTKMELLLQLNVETQNTFWFLE